MFLKKQTDNDYLSGVVENISKDVQGGLRFSSALAKYPKIFDDFYVNMVRAGETSGKLDEVLNYLADEQEKNYDLMSKIKRSNDLSDFRYCWGYWGNGLNDDFCYSPVNRRFRGIRSGITIANPYFNYNQWAFNRLFTFCYYWNHYFDFWSKILF